MHGIARRELLLATAASLAGCSRPPPEVAGSFAGATPERGHVLRDPSKLPRTPDRTRQADIVIAGAGIAGLAAARALRQQGIEDYAILDLEDDAGGNSRGGQLAGIACPLGAHYLPVPGDAAHEVQDLLEEVGLRRRVAGRWEIDERHLCHAPQERLWIQGEWQDGFLPQLGAGASTLAQYAHFAAEIEALRRSGAFRIPVRDPARLRPWDQQTFAAWLAARDLHDASLRWYLDYCCRDDYGAGIDAVSAAAGLHYFAARHGFRAPGFDEPMEHEGVLTWPEGNAWLAKALQAPNRDRFQGGRVVVRIAEGRGGVEVDAWDAGRRTLERWQARQCIVALPVFVAARVVENAPTPLRTLAGRLRYAPWIVANVHLKEPLHHSHDEGTPLAWDNVLYGTRDSVGYVVATHQKLDPTPGPTVLSWYCAPGLGARADVLQQPWTFWRDRLVAELVAPHPDLPKKITAVQVARYGHGMAVPGPGFASQPAPPDSARVRYAHADWSGYSIFEEAFTRGHVAGLGAAKSISPPPGRAKADSPPRGAAQSTK